MINRFWLGIQTLCLMIAWAGASELLAQTASIDPQLLLKLEGQTIDIVLSNGDVLANQQVAELKLTENADGVQLLKVQLPNSRKSKTIRLNLIQEIYLGDRPLDVTYDRKNRSLIHDVEKRSLREEHQQEVADRLADQKQRYWPLLEAADHQQYMDRHHAFVEKCKNALPDLKLQTVETQFYIFTTDLTADEVNGYLVYLDEMYRQLCKAFGLSAEKNIWCGKCVVVTFREKETYLRFEKEVMGVDAEGSQGLCHQSSDGTVIFAGFKGTNGFGHVLVHETTHGFMHRYMTSARIPSWLNEGISDWMANAVVKGDRGNTRALQSAQLAMAAGGLGDFLTTERIPAGTYGAACTMVELLLARDKGQQFKQYLILLKEGIEPETALQQSFGLTYTDLEALYAARIRTMKR